MSDRLAARLREIAGHSKPEKPDDPNARRIEAMQKALDATTPERAGCPWDNDDREAEPEKGIWMSAGEEEPKKGNWLP